MKVIIIVLCVIIVIMMGLLWKYQRQIKDICRQLSFQQEHTSNMRITSEIDLGEIKELTEILNDLLENQKKERIQYQRKEQIISETYTSLSHDIRTPLTSLDGYFQLLADSDSREEQERYIGIIKERINSLKEMLEELFLFTKLKNTSYQLDLVSCDLNRIVKDTIFSYYEEWKRKSIEPEIYLPEGTVMFMGNEQALRRIVQNIIKNGLEHGEDSIKICMTVTSKKKGLVKEPIQDITQSDRGGKITLLISNPVSNQEQIDVNRVFERFYKADTLRSTSSTGLGLPIAREFVLRMNGRIEAFVQGNEFGVKIDFPFNDAENDENGNYG